MAVSDFLAIFATDKNHTPIKAIMEEITKLNSIDKYCELHGMETPHPLVAVVDVKNATKLPNHFTLSYGIYALFLKENVSCAIQYGRQKYEYEEGTVTSFAPGQVTHVNLLPGVTPKCRGLLFHPDLIKGTPLAREMRNYTFFSYSSNEALHLSEEEKKIFNDCLDKIQIELDRPIDKFSKRLIAMNIELLLNYCLRFYARQFVTREVNNKDVLTRFENYLEDYFDSDLPKREGLPSVKYFADKVCLSPNYFGDLIKKETGMTAQEHIQNKIMDLAKSLLLGTEKSVTEISYELGFQYSQHFNRVFKKNTGLTPSGYRKGI